MTPSNTIEKSKTKTDDEKKTVSCFSPISLFCLSMESSHVLHVSLLRSHVHHVARLH